MWGESFFLNYSFIFGKAIQFLLRASKKEMREGGSQREAIISPQGSHETAELADFS